MLDVIKQGLLYFSKGLSQVAFPDVCVCCGVETPEHECHLCSFCKERRFVYANSDYQLSSSGAILPDNVLAQHALWQFDKGGVLQDLLHYLKYERLTGIGFELGKVLGESLIRHPHLNNLMNDSSLLVPVPLHYLKFRKRGFNQAFMIAKGVREVCNIPICKPNAVIRKKNTHSQTGFSFRKRMTNIQNAFQVKDAEAFAGKRIIIVDDVFTTGSTTFEVARTLKKTDYRVMCITTIAQA